ncbi:MAG: M20 family metallopeptidase [Lachnospiraceae bacterium]|nr:M20 family metallopeptidase [Lachnospiraceae bacterium]
MDFREQARALQPQLLLWRRRLHQIPELNNETFMTAGEITQFLRAIGIPAEDIRPMVNGAGLAVTIHGKDTGRCVGIRVDIDALAEEEKTGLPFASLNGNMHACGHDTHAAMGLGAAKLLFENRESLNGAVKVIFQPGEELYLGAKAMIEEGVLEDPKVDACIAVHGMPNLVAPGFSCGSISVTNGIPAFGCSSFFEMKFIGKGGHTAHPEKAVDPVFMQAAAIMQLYGVISRETNPATPAVISVSYVNGRSVGRIAEDITIGGVLRSLDKKRNQWMFDRMATICKSVAESMGGSCECKMTDGVPETRVNPELLEIAKASAAKIVGPEKVVIQTEADLVGEDFAYFAERIPCVHIKHSQRYDNGPNDHYLHNPQYAPCEDCFWTGSGTLAQFAWDYLEKSCD